MFLEGWLSFIAEAGEERWGEDTGGGEVVLSLVAADGLCGAGAEVGGLLSGGTGADDSNWAGGSCVEELLCFLDVGVSVSG